MVHHSRHPKIVIRIVDFCIQNPKICIFKISDVEFKNVFEDSFLNKWSGVPRFGCPSVYQCNHQMTSERKRRLHWYIWTWRIDNSKDLTNKTKTFWKCNQVLIVGFGDNDYAIRGLMRFIKFISRESIIEDVIRDRGVPNFKCWWHQLKRRSKFFYISNLSLEKTYYKGGHNP